MLFDNLLTNNILYSDEGIPENPLLKNSINCWISKSRNK